MEQRLVANYSIAHDIVKMFDTYHLDKKQLSKLNMRTVEELNALIESLITELTNRRNYFNKKENKNVGTSSK